MFFLIAIVIMLSILMLGHLALYYFVVSVFFISSTTALIILRTLIVLLPLLFVGSLVLSSFYNNFFTRTFYKAMAGWLAFFMYLFLSAVVYSIFNFLSLATPLFGELLFIFGLIVAIYGIINSNVIRIVKLTVSLPSLPEGWKGRKVVFMSDLHLGQIRGKAFARRIAKKINVLSPDIVLIGGDVYDGVRVNTVDIISPLKEISSQFGTFFIMGNHEEFNDNTRYKKALTEAGIRVLLDEVVDVDGLQIVGVDYHTTEKKEVYEKVLAAIPVDPSRASILLKHVPLHLEVAEAKGISLSLSGHTHRAQAFPLNIFTHFIYKGYDYGLKRFGSMINYTSCGVGTWGPPIRVGSQSEIILITLA